MQALPAQRNIGRDSRLALVRKSPKSPQRKRWLPTAKGHSSLTLVIEKMLSSGISSGFIALSDSTAQDIQRKRNSRQYRIFRTAWTRGMPWEVISVSEAA